MGTLLASLRALGTARLIAMAGVAATLVGVLLFLAFRSPATRLDLLYADLVSRR